MKIQIVHLKQQVAEAEIPEEAVAEAEIPEEAVVEITCTEPGELVKVAWHLGNRHLAAEIYEDRIYIRPDHVIVAMVEGLGADTRLLERSFDPESGAYHAKVIDAQVGHEHR